MIKRCTLLRRRADISAPAFSDHWASVHADIAAGFDGLARYNQNHVTRICWQRGQPRFQVDGIVELWFRSQADVDHAAHSATTRALIVDEPNFLSGLTALSVGEAALSEESRGDRTKYMILAKTDKPETLETALRSRLAALGGQAAETVNAAVDPLTPGFTRETLWSEPDPPNILASVWIRGGDGADLIGDDVAPLRTVFETGAQAALAIEVSELRIV